MSFHRAFSPVHGSQTLTDTSSIVQGPFVLHLRGEPSTATSNDIPEPARVTWAEDVIDNEGMGKKTSKGEIRQLAHLDTSALTSPYLACCIYHKPRAVGESSSESSSEEDDSESNEDNSKARMAGAKGKQKAKHTHDNEECEHSEGDFPGKKRISKPKKGKRPSPNAYEKMPKAKGKGGPITKE
ncbi:MAG: hypothetical protein M1829_002782 [Trizodia sp. TS-e1964]|nr:MAG: hypothetical protein M1829_002782 [Trizodia sp. TS-e1964]